MTQRMLTPEEIKALSARLEASTDALIANHQRINTKPKVKSGRPANVLENPLREKIATVWNHCHVNGLTAPGWLDDLITGASRTNVGSNQSLNRGYILKCLAGLDIITTESVATRLRISEVQARKYLQAIRLIYPRLETHVDVEIALIEAEEDAMWDDEQK